MFLVDFGAVKAVVVGAAQSRTSTNIYTAGYAPPEQTHGTRVFPSSDLYALGATAIHLLTGTHPQQLFDSAYMTFRWSAQVAPEFRRVLDKLTQVAPVARYAHAREVLADLAALDQAAGRKPLSLPRPAASVGLLSPTAPDDPGQARPQGAVVQLQRDPLREPRLSPEQRERLKQHVAAGWKLAAEREHEGALKEFNEALGLLASSAEAHCGLGYVFSQIGDDAQAARACREAIRLDSKLALAHSVLGDVLFGQSDTAGAVREYREAIRQEPNDGPTHTSLGDCLLELGDREGAIAEFREAIRCDPADPQAHNQLGHALWDKSDFSGSIWEFCEAIRIDPNYGWAHQNLGRALAKQNDLDGAAREFREALRCDPSLLQARLDLGDALAATGHNGDAVREYREALRLDPNNRYARQQLGIALTKKIDRR